MRLARHRIRRRAESESCPPAGASEDDPMWSRAGSCGRKTPSGRVCMPSPHVRPGRFCDPDPARPPGPGPSWGRDLGYRKARSSTPPQGHAIGPYAQVGATVWRRRPAVSSGTPGAGPDPARGPEPHSVLRADHRPPAQARDRPRPEGPVPRPARRARSRARDRDRGVRRVVARVPARVGSSSTRSPRSPCRLSRSRHAPSTSHGSSTHRPRRTPFRSLIAIWPQVRLSFDAPANNTAGVRRSHGQGGAARVEVVRTP